MSERAIMPRDQVCGVILNEKTAKFHMRHEDETYYFCSVICKKRLKKNRDKFVK
jgi:YHS domain-containing protein